MDTPNLELNWATYLDNISGFFKPCKNSAVLQISSDSARYTSLIDLYTPDSVTLVDDNLQNVLNLKNTFPEHKVIHTDVFKFFNIEKQYNMVVCFDILHRVKSPLYLLELIVTRAFPEFILVETMWDNSIADTETTKTPNFSQPGEKTMLSTDAIIKFMADSGYKLLGHMLDQARFGIPEKEHAKIVLFKKLGNWNQSRVDVLKNKVIKINNVSPSFCTAKWLQTTLYLQNGYNHSCHHPSPHKIPLAEIAKDPAALHNSEFKKSQRALMLDGKRPKECDYCWKIEDLNKDYISDRHYKTTDTWAWDRFEEIAESKAADNVYPSYLEVSLSNACNFKCVYCSPEISSKWLEEIQQFGPYPISRGAHDLNWLKQVERFPYKHSDHNPYIEAFWKWFPDAIKQLKVFRITGGEPLMSKDLWGIFDYITENPQPNMDLAINTNLCVEKKLIDKFIEKIEAIKKSVNEVIIFTSLESTGAQAEYARFGLNYDTWLENTERVLDTKTNVAIMTTINILSLPTFNDFIDTIIRLRAKHNNDNRKNRITLTINYLRWPPHLSVKILDKESRIAYAESIKDHCKQYLVQVTPHKNASLYLEEWDQIQRFCDYLIQDEDTGASREDFVKFIEESDLRRNTSFSETFPELLPFFKTCKEIT
jgi:pyruvate-formate lyase-activating enzyme